MRRARLEGMTTVVLDRSEKFAHAKLVPSWRSLPLRDLAGYASLVMVAASISYFAAPEAAALRAISLHGALFAVVMPVAAFALSVASLRGEASRGGRSCGVASLAVTTLYFTAALAIPATLLFVYVLYVYLL